MSPYVIILELRDNSNSDQVILEAVNMYKADFNLPEIAFFINKIHSNSKIRLHNN